MEGYCPFQVLSQHLDQLQVKSNFHTQLMKDIYFTGFFIDKGYTFMPMDFFVCDPLSSRKLIIFVLTYVVLSYATFPADLNMSFSL